MLLSDYLKRPDQQSGGKYLSPAAPVTRENEVDFPKPVWQQNQTVAKDTSTRSAEQVRESNPKSVSDAYKLPSSDVVERINSGEDVFKALLDKKFNDGKESIERQRKAAFLGDLANLFGQTVASAQGARQFSPIQSKVPYYNEQLQKLKSWHNDADINYSLSQVKNDYEAKKYQQKLSLDKYKMDLQQGQFGERLRLDYQKLAENVRKNKITQAQADKKLAEMMRHNQATERTASYNADSSRISANAAKERAKKAGGSANGNESIVVTDGNKKQVAVTYPKEKRGAVISLYNRMKRLSAENPGKYGDALDDINLQVGEGGDQATKAMTIIQHRLQDFPELTDEFYNIIGTGPKPSGGLLPESSNNRKGSLLP